MLDFDDADIALVVCVPWQGEDAHTAGSVKMECAICEIKIAASVTAQTMLTRKDVNALEYICVFCAKRRYATEPAHDIPGFREEMLVDPYLPSAEGNTIGEMADDWMKKHGVTDVSG